MTFATYTHAMMTIFNELRNDVISEVMNTLKNRNLFTTEIDETLQEMSHQNKTKKTLVKKEKKPRFSGYHLFMKEHRVVVKNQQPGIKPQQLTTIVSKAWKDIPEDAKRDLNDRALKMKEAYYNKDTEESNIESIEEQEKKSLKQVRKLSSNEKQVNKECSKVLKERFDNVKQVHRATAAKLMSSFLKDHECSVVDTTNTPLFEKALAYAIGKVNQQQDTLIFETTKEEEKEESESELESESDEDSDDEEGDMRLVTDSSDSDCEYDF